MKQIFHPYTQWEDFIHGMYETDLPGDHAAAIAASVEMLANELLFLATAIDMVAAWPISSAVNLSNVSINRKAWVGQAACCFNHNAPETLTRLSWAMLTDQQRFAANRAADRVIYDYENADRRLHSNMGTPLLFQWNT
jgi:hypothetical protein